MTTSGKDEQAWSDLKIDWDRYHPDARELLHDPFFWDTAEDFGPHGNDTGFDTLSNVEEWQRDSPDSNFTADDLANLYVLSGIESDEANWDAYSRSTGRQTAVAAAFALVKLRAKCPDWLVVRIRKLINSEADSSKREFPDWAHRGEWLAAMDRTLAALAAFSPKH